MFFCQYISGGSSEKFQPYINQKCYRKIKSVKLPAKINPKIQYPQIFKTSFSIDNHVNSGILPHQSQGNLPIKLTNCNKKRLVHKINSEFTIRTSKNNFKICKINSLKIITDNDSRKILYGRSKLLTSVRGDKCETITPINIYKIREGTLQSKQQSDFEGKKVQEFKQKDKDLIRQSKKWSFISEDATNQSKDQHNIWNEKEQDEVGLFPEQIFEGQTKVLQFLNFYKLRFQSFPNQRSKISNFQTLITVETMIQQHPEWQDGANFNDTNYAEYFLKQQE